MWRAKNMYIHGIGADFSDEFTELWSIYIVIVLRRYDNSFRTNLMWLRARYYHRSNEQVSVHFASENESIPFGAHRPTYASSPVTSEH